MLPNGISEYIEDSYVSTSWDSLDSLLTPVVDTDGLLLCFAWKDNEMLTAKLLAYNEIPSC